MKKILVFAFVLFSVSAMAQNPFSSTDTLRNYINRYIRNSAVEAFQNLRLNRTLNGISYFLDSAYGGQVRSFAKINDTTARLITIANDTFDISTGSGVAGAGFDTLYIKKAGTGTALHFVDGDSLKIKAIQAGSNITLTQNADSSITIAASGGSGSPGGSTTQVQFNNAGAFGGTSRFTWDNTNNRMAIFGTSTVDLTRLNDHSLKIIGNYAYLGDTTSSEPTRLEFGARNTGGQRVRGSVGIDGTREFNYGVNFDYRGGIHRYYDTAYDMVYHFLGDNGWGMQVTGKGHPNTGDVWNSYGIVNWRVDHLRSGNEFTGSRTSTNQLYLYQTGTTDQNMTTGTKAIFSVESAALNFSGVTQFNTADSVSIGVGTTASTSYKLNVLGTGAFQPFQFADNDNDAGNMIGRFLRQKSGSYTLTSGTKVGFDVNSVASFTFNATGDAPGGFSSFDGVVRTQNSTGTIADRWWFGQNGDLRNTASEDATSAFTISSTTKGALFPRMNTTQQNAIATPTNGLTIYNTDSSDLFVYKSTAWARAGSSSGGGGGGTYTASNGLTMTTNDTKLGGSLTANTDIDLTTSNYDLNFKRNGTTIATVDGTGILNVPSTGWLTIGDLLNETAADKFQVKYTATDTRFRMSNVDNNTNKNIFFFNKTRAGSYNLTDGDVIGRIDGNTLGSIDMVAGGTATGGFKPFHFDFRTADNAGTVAARMRITNLGEVLIGTTTDNAAANLQVTGGVYLSGLNTATSSDTKILVKGASDSVVRQLDFPITSTTYTVTLTNTTNIASSSTNTTYYQRLGDVVHVWGEFTATASATGVCEMGFSIPVSSAFANTYDGNGTGASDAYPVKISSDSVNGRMKFRWTAPNTSATTHSFHFTYKIMPT